MSTATRRSAAAGGNIPAKVTAPRATVVAGTKAYNLEAAGRPKEGGKAALKIGYTEDDREEEIDAVLKTADPIAHLSTAARAKARGTLKDYLMKQSATGSVIEFQAMRLVQNPELQKVFDWARVVISKNPHGYELLKKIIPNSAAAETFRGTNKEKIFLKCKFDLSAVNSDNTIITGTRKTWKELGVSNSVKKGKMAVEPDLITYSWPVGAPRPILKVFELKVGDGENKSGEHEQLMRVVHLLRNHLIPELVRLGWISAQYIPDVQIFFCAWRFGVANPLTEPNFTLWKEFGGNVPAAWRVKKLNGAYEFTGEVKINPAAIQALLLSMQLRREEALHLLLSKYRRFGRFGALRAETWARITNKLSSLGYANPFTNPVETHAGKAETAAGRAARLSAVAAMGGRPLRAATKVTSYRFKNAKLRNSKARRAIAESGYRAAQSLGRVAASVAPGAIPNYSQPARLFINQFVQSGGRPENLGRFLLSAQGILTSGAGQAGRSAIEMAAAATPRVAAARAGFEATRAATIQRQPSLGGLFPN